MSIANWWKRVLAQQAQADAKPDREPWPTFPESCEVCRYSLDKNDRDNVLCRLYPNPLLVRRDHWCGSFQKDAIAFGAWVEKVEEQRGEH